MPTHQIQIFPANHHQLRWPAGLDFHRLTNANFRKYMINFQPQSELAEYANSWLYLTQACRGAFSSYGTLIRQAQFVAGLGRHNRHWVIVRPLGYLPEDFLTTLSKLISTTNANPFVFVKKAGPDMRSQFADLARINKVRVLGASVYPWDRNAPHDDDTFPELVIPLSEMFRALAKMGRPLHRLRSQLRRFELLRLTADMSTVADLGIDRVLEMLRDHFESDHSYVESYVNMVRILSHVMSQDTWRHFVPTLGGEPVGLFAYDRLDPRSAGVYASLASKHFPGLGETMMLQLFNLMSHEGIEYVNLGGSETEGLNNYKRKFTGSRDSHFGIRHRYPILVLDLRTMLRE